MKTSSRDAVIAIVLLPATLLILALALPAIPQDPDYHHFADSQAILGIPNFWNVISNLPFLIIAIAASKQTVTPRAMSRIFRAGIFLTGLGSAYYHWNPNTDTLFWDRLPMTIGFAAVTAGIISTRVDQNLGRRMLWPLIVASAATVIYWRWTERTGQGNLAPYGVVQFGTVLTVFAIQLLFPSKNRDQKILWLALALYVLAKILEAFDHQIASALNILGGHPLKHVAAAVGCWFLWLGIFAKTNLPVSDAARSRS